MSITHVQNNSSNTFSQQTFLTVTLTGVTFGNVIIVTVDGWTGSGVAASMSCSDSSGNTYVIDADISVAYNVNSITSLFIFRTVAGLGGTTTFTVNSTQTAAITMSADEFSLGGALVFDTSGNATGSGNSPASASMGILANDFVVAIFDFRTTGLTYTANTGFTFGFTNKLLLGNPFAMEYNLDEATTPIAPGLTLSSTSQWSGLGVGYIELALVSGAATLTSVATITENTTLTHNAKTALACVMTFTPHPTVGHAANLVCSSTMTAKSKLTYRGTLTLTSVETLTDNAKVTHKGSTSSMSCVSTFTPGCTVIHNAKAALHDVATIAPFGFIGEEGAATLHSVTSLTGAALLEKMSGANLLCSSTLIPHAFGSLLRGIGSLTCITRIMGSAATVRGGKPGTLTSISTLIASAKVNHIGSKGPMFCVTSIGLKGFAIHLDTCHFTSTSTLHSLANPNHLGTCNLLSITSLIAKGSVTHRGLGGLASISSMSCVGHGVKRGNTLLACSSTLGTSAQPSHGGTALFQGTSGLHGVGIVTHRAKALLQSSGALLGHAGVTHPSHAALGSISQLHETTSAAHLGSALLVSHSTLTCSTKLNIHASCHLLEVSSLVQTKPPGSVMRSVSTLSGMGNAVHHAKVSLHCTSSLQGIVSKTTKLGTASLHCVASIVVASKVQHAGSLGLVCQASCDGLAVKEAKGIAALYCVATINSSYNNVMTVLYPYSTVKQISQSPLYGTAVKVRV